LEYTPGRALPVSQRAALANLSRPD